MARRRVVVVVPRGCADEAWYARILEYCTNRHEDIDSIVVCDGCRQWGEAEAMVQRGEVAAIVVDRLDGLPLPIEVASPGPTEAQIGHAVADFESPVDRSAPSRRRPMPRRPAA